MWVFLFVCACVFDVLFCFHAWYIIEGRVLMWWLPCFHEQTEPPKFQYVGPQYQPTWTEQEIARRKKMARKKEEKKKAREEEKSKSVWNIDNEICTMPELDFRSVCVVYVSVCVPVCVSVSV